MSNLPYNDKIEKTVEPKSDHTYHSCEENKTNNDTIEDSEFKPVGYRTNFVIGYNTSAAVTFWDDDGSWGKHMTLYIKDIPVGTFPLVNMEGVVTFVSILTNFCLWAYGDKGKDLLEKRFSENLEWYSKKAKGVK